jgi:ABC-type Fe3+/spermidine/putrescine transport system ATPase subunit
MISVNNISLNLDNFSLKEISFEVKTGEFYILLGPTGAGKSVILETIGGLMIPDEGHIFINHEEVTFKRPEKRHISICYQDYALFPHMTVEENIRYGLKFMNDRNRAMDFNQLVEMLKIRALLDRYPLNLSGGEKQRVSIARALIIRPEVLLLDEPLAALDAHIKDELMRDLRNLNRQLGMTVIMITHSFQEAYFLGDRISVVNEGSIEQSGTMKELLNNPKSRFVANFVGLKNVFKAETIGVLGKEYIGIRPEKVRMGIQEKDLDHVFRGKIIDIADMGTYCELLIESNQYNFHVDILFDVFINEEYMIGDDISFGFSENDIVVLDGFIA